MDTDLISRTTRPTLSHFIRHNLSHDISPTEDIAQIFDALVLAAKQIHQLVGKTGLSDIVGVYGHQNATGDRQQKLDVLAHRLFSHSFSEGRQVCALASEEAESYEALNHQGKYVVTIDPLDGSSNIDINAPIGTIFSIYRRITPVDSPPQLEDVLQRGSDQWAAGYILYGTSTILVYTSLHGVHGFTYDPALEDFFLSHANIKAPVSGSLYSVNEGSCMSFPQGIKKYIRSCKESRYTARYIGALVADFHRNLLKGGIYLYPPTAKQSSGKLRLVYECNALALIAEQAGGKASDGNQRILDIPPEALHQRVPFYVGSRNMVEQAEQYIAEN